MAYSFSRPSARRAARVLALQRSSSASEGAAAVDGGERGEAHEATALLGWGSVRRGERDAGAQSGC
ncbi:hypothetical protein SANTM175S_02300 [Streptomyces antimycoticus]